ncbi:MAG: NAD(P)/FAD-dependent oxidoreductase [Jatrophihabitantaceae bacterium]
MTSHDPVVIVGGGPAALVLGMFLARRGMAPLILERREAVQPSDAASSINLTLCARGFSALDALGVSASVAAHTVPLYGRRLHLADGTFVYQRYGPPDEALFALTRNCLMRVLGDLARRQVGVTVGFGQRCVAIDPQRPAVQVQDQATGARRWINAAAVIGADGAFSSVRRLLQGQGLVTASIERAALEYRQVTLFGGRSWTGHMNTLHVWPRGDEMMLAIPNSDGSVTAGLLVDAEKTAVDGPLASESRVLEYFRTTYPGAGLEVEAYAHEFLERRAAPLITVRCRPWNVGRVLLVGDAAHGMLPSYGQGANAAFEDALLLDECIESAGSDWESAFSRFHAARHRDTDRMADLARQHLVDLRSSMADPAWQLRAQVESLLSRVSGDRFVSLYRRIAFTTAPYSEAIAEDRRWSPLVESLLALEVVRAGPASAAAEAAARAVLAESEPIPEVSSERSYAHRAP